MTGSDQSQIPPNLSPAYTESSSYMSGFRLVGKHGEIRAGPQTVRPEREQGQTHSRALADPYSKDRRTTGRTNLSGPAAHIPHRTFDSHRKKKST